MGKRQKIVVLMTEWGKFCPLKGEDGRDERLLYLTGIAGRVVQSANELSEQELNDVILQLRKDRNRAEKRADKITTKEIWKIRQLEGLLRWTGVPARLEGFLRAKCNGVSRPEYLSRDQAWRAIEALKSTLARWRVKQRRGEAHEVLKRELRDELADLRQELEYFRPS